DRAADIRRERGLAAMDLVTLQALDAEFLEVRPLRDVTRLSGGGDRIDGPARDVLDVDTGTRLEIPDHVRVEAPAGQCEAREARLGRVVDRRQQARRGA